MKETEQDAEAGRPKKAGGAPPPNRVAEKILDEMQLVTDDGDQVYGYQDGAWRPLSEAALKRIARFADGSRHTSARRRSEIVSYLRATTQRTIEWGRVGDAEVAAANCIVNAKTGEARPHSPDDFLERTLPHEYSALAPCPRWFEALAEWFGEWDGCPPAEVLALQEFFGYVVLSHAKFKKCLLLFGGSDTGKSVVVFVLKELVGEANTCSLPVDQMDDPVRRAVIKGKLLNVVSEITADAMVSDGGFKQMVSTEEPLLIDEKYKPSEMYVPRAKHCIATNTLPRLNDRTEASLNRFLIIPMRKVIPRDKQDDGLKPALQAEMKGILCWAIEGARRLIERHGQFMEVPSAAALLAELRNDANPVRLYMGERCVADALAATPLSVMCDDFNKWNKGSRKVSVRSFGKMVRDAGQVTKLVRDRKVVAMCVIGFAVVKDEVKAQYRVAADAILAEGDEVEAETAESPS